MIATDCMGMGMQPRMQETRARLLLLMQLGSVEQCQCTECCVAQS